MVVNVDDFGFRPYPFVEFAHPVHIGAVHHDTGIKPGLFGQLLHVFQSMPTFLRHDIKAFWEWVRADNPGFFPEFFEQILESQQAADGIPFGSYMSGQKKVFMLSQGLRDLRNGGQFIRLSVCRHWNVSA